MAETIEDPIQKAIRLLTAHAEGTDLLGWEDLHGYLFALLSDRDKLVAEVEARREAARTQEDIWSEENRQLEAKLSALEGAAKTVLNELPTLLVKAIREPGDGAGLDAWTAAIVALRASLDRTVPAEEPKNGDTMWEDGIYWRFNSSLNRNGSWVAVPKDQEPALPMPEYRYQQEDTSGGQAVHLTPWDPQCAHCSSRFSTRWEKAEHEKSHALPAEGEGKLWTGQPITADQAEAFDAYRDMQRDQAAEAAALSAKGKALKDMNPAELRYMEDKALADALREAQQLLESGAPKGRYSWLDAPVQIAADRLATPSQEPQDARREKLRALVLGVEDFINFPPSQHAVEPMAVRDYRHALYSVWSPLADAILNSEGAGS